MHKAGFIAAALLCAGVSPALADPSCLGSDNRGFSVSGRFAIGKISEADQAQFDIMEARRHGIDAATAERTWLECIKITRREDGRWVTEYYDPRTWELKQRG